MATVARISMIAMPNINSTSENPKDFAAGKAFNTHLLF